MTKEKETQKPFEENMEELDSVLNKLEQGEATLANSLAQFEKGMSLIESCRKQLDTAEVTVEKIIAKNSAQ